MAAIEKVKLKKVRDYFKNGILRSVGFLNLATRKPAGEWQFFNEFGRITSRGKFDPSGRKIGVWLVYDWRSGDHYRETFSAGKSVETVFVKKITGIPPQNLPDALHQILRLSAGAK